MTRIEQLRRLIKSKNLDAILLNDPTDIYYFCGFTGSNAYLLCTRETNLLITDRRYAQRVKNEVGREFNPTVAKGNLTKTVMVQLQTQSVHKIGISETKLSLAEHSRMLESNSGLNFIGIGDSIHAITSLKSEDEQQKITSALNLTETILERTIAELQAGQTEQQVSRNLQMKALSLGSDSVAFSPIIAWNKNSAEPHYATAHTQIIGRGFILIDCGFMRNGFASDITRMVHIGPPTDKFKVLYEHVRTAKNMAIEMMVPGGRINEVVQAVMNYFDKYKIGQYFTHALGHGLGRNVHEYPVLRSDSEQYFSEGMVLTVEPGIYIPGWGGIRIEDTVLIRSDGAEILNKTSDEYYSLPFKNVHDQTPS